MAPFCAAMKKRAECLLGIFLLRFGDRVCFWYFFAIFHRSAMQAYLAC